MYYSTAYYALDHFEKSRNPAKKYDAILRKKDNGKLVRVPFGQIGYEQYKDSALGLYKNDDHHDKARLKQYRSRHAGFLKDGFYSPSYFSWYYLW